MKNALANTARVCLVALLLNCLLFFRGCDNHRLQCSLGAVVPFAKVEVANQIGAGMLPTRLYDVSPVLVVINVALAILIGIGFIRLPAARRAWASLLVACALTNSFVLSIHVWLFGVFIPVCRIGEVAIWVITMGRPKQVQPTTELLVLILASRAWLALVFALVYFSLALIASVRLSRVRLRVEEA